MAFATDTALALAVVVLAAVNLLNNRLAVSAYVVTSLAATTALLAMFRWAGAPWADAGLGREALGRGIRCGPALVALVALAYLAGALIPATRRLFLDPRVRPARPATHAYQVLVRIPLGTVLFEEVAFRGVVYGLVRSTHGVVWATVVSCALFGLWHILPARDLVRLRRAPGLGPGRAPGLGPDGQRAAPVVVVAVGASALAGLALCELQRRTGSLVPAIALHWATNGLGYLAAVLVLRPRPS